MVVTKFMQIKNRLQKKMIVSSSFHSIYLTRRQVFKKHLTTY